LALQQAERIELNFGWTEAGIHASMLATLGVATLAVLTLEINIGVLGGLLIACICHEILFWCDLVCASRRRNVGPMEQ
jgi:hypothetical protein